MAKNLPANTGHARAVGSILVPGRPPGGRNGNPLRYSSVQNPMDRRALPAIVHGVSKESDMTEQLNAVEQRKGKKHRTSKDTCLLVTGGARVQSSTLSFGSGNAHVLQNSGLLRTSPM